MSNLFLENKTVLFFGQVLYDYHFKIISQLENFGARVIFIENKIFMEDPVISKHPLNVFKRLINPKYKFKYVKAKLETVETIQIDYLFCIGGFSVVEDLVVSLKLKYPGIKTVLYLWDSFSIWNYPSIVKLFDAAYTFDRNDAALYDGLEYLPLFYSSEFCRNIKINTESNIDLLYIGSVGLGSIKRLELLIQVYEQAKQHNVRNFFWVYVPANIQKTSLSNYCRFLTSSKYRKFLRLIFYAKKKYNFISSSTLNKQQIVELMQRSSVVLDIPIDGQIGLTIRTIETLAMGIKLITTNESIKNESFYNAEEIELLNAGNPSLNIDFIYKEHINSTYDISHLALPNWIMKIFTF